VYISQKRTGRVASADDSLTMITGALDPEVRTHLSHPRIGKVISRFA
jgi:hypothetical protein